MEQLNFKNKEIAHNLQSLQESVSELIAFYRQNKDYQRMVYKFWNTKDILGHLTFWHESFARNIDDLANDEKPNPLKGKLSEINQLSVDSTRDFSIEELIRKLKTAQEKIEKNIFNDHISLIPYKKGSRAYSREEHLEVVAGHIKRHLKDLNKKYK